jgi:hypothetical protein
VFTPNESIAFIQNMWDNYRPTVWGPYGWKDGFNLSTGPWVATDVIGIDQGPILVMIENHLNEKPWQRFMSHPAIQLGLAKADFQPFVLGVTPGTEAAGLQLGPITPDPMTSRARDHVPSRARAVARHLARRPPGPRGTASLVAALARGRAFARDRARRSCRGRLLAATPRRVRNEARALRAAAVSPDL